MRWPVIDSVLKETLRLLDQGPIQYIDTEWALRHP